MFSSKHVIDATVQGLGDNRWVRVTGIYGTSYREEKKGFWEWMHSQFQPTDIPWLYGGDFNEFIWESDKLGGAAILYKRPRYLSNFMEAAELMDLEFSGPSFTWRGIRNGELVEEQIDKGLCNLLWLERWSNTVVIHDPVVASDHSLLLIWCQSHPSKGKKRFQFEAFWAKEEDCCRLIESCWQTAYHGDLVQSWQARLNDCRSRLLKWSKRKFNRCREEIDDLLVNLQELQTNSGENDQEIKDKTILLDRLQQHGESFWQQQSRVKWLQEGDANTDFFHQSTLQRQRWNKVEMIKREGGEWEQNPKRVQQLFDEYFIKLFTSSRQRDWAHVLECVTPVVTDGMNQALMMPILDDEIEDAARQLGGLKAWVRMAFQVFFIICFGIKFALKFLSLFIF